MSFSGRGFVFGRKAISSSDDSRLSSEKNVVLPQFITWLVVVVVKGGEGRSIMILNCKHISKKNKKSSDCKVASGGMTL